MSVTAAEINEDIIVALTCHAPPAFRNKML